MSRLRCGNFIADTGPNRGTYHDVTCGASLLFPRSVGPRPKGEYRDLFDDLRKQGFNRARVDGEVFGLDSVPSLDRYSKHNIELVIDRIPLKDASRQRIAEAVDTALRFGEGTLLLAYTDIAEVGKHPSLGPALTSVEPSATRKRSGRKKSNDESSASSVQTLETSSTETVSGRILFDPRLDIVFSSSYSCAKCGCSYQPPSPQLLSFNSPQGACQTCEGLGESFTFDPELLVTKPNKSIRNGAIDLIGKQTEMTDGIVVPSLFMQESSRCERGCLSAD